MNDNDLSLLYPPDPEDNTHSYKTFDVTSIVTYVPLIVGINMEVLLFYLLTTPNYLTGLSFLGSRTVNSKDCFTVLRTD